MNLMANVFLKDGKSGKPKGSFYSNLPYKVLSGLAIASLFLASCARPATPPTTVSPTATEIIETYTPTVEPTSTALPTLEPITLGAFTAEFKGGLPGFENNGTMVCTEYTGNTIDLDKLTLKANITQGTNKIETDIPSQLINGRICFEASDGKLFSISPVDNRIIIPDTTYQVEINATSSEGRQVVNNGQKIELGKYVLFNFLTWAFPVTQMCKNGDYNYTGQHPAFDWVPKPTSTYPGLVNIPVLAPGDGKVIYVLATESGQTSIMFYSPSTGLLHFLKHTDNTGILDGKMVNMDELVGREFRAGDQLSTLGYLDVGPHLHWSITNSQYLIQKALAGEGESVVSSDIGAAFESATWIDYVASKIFIDPTIIDHINSAVSCSYLPIGTISLPPQQLPFKIDGSADDWAGYSPVLTDPAGDSHTGAAMDFTQLLTAKDDNYLYFILELGNEPSMQYWFNMHLDTSSEDQCGTADKLLQFSVLDPTGFSYGSLKGCEEGSDTKQYNGANFVMGAVLEGKIPRYLLGDPDKLDITKVIGFTYDGNVVSTQDTMP